MLMAQSIPCRLFHAILIYSLFITTVAASHQLLTLRKRDAFEVTRPAAGDTVSTPFSEQNHYVQLEWTVAADTTNRPVAIHLRRGLNISELETLQVVTGTSLVFPSSR
jgi:hypothetical protein